MVFKKMDMKSVFLCVLVLSVQLVCGQYISSPCPDIFNFIYDGRHVYGKIILKPVGQVSSIIITVNFTLATQLFSDFAGRIDAHDRHNLIQRYNRGQVISYLIHFPVKSPVPKLTAITVNGDTVCSGPGDIPSRDNYVTSLSLQHSSYLQSGPPPEEKPPDVNGPVRIQADHVHYGDDDATAIIIPFDNIEPSWNTNTSPYSVVNSSSPFGPIKQPVPQHAQPIPNYDPENSHTVQEVPDRVIDRVTTRPPAIYRPTNPIPEQHSNSNTQIITSECGEVAGGNEGVPLIYNGNAYPRGDIPWLVAIYRTEASALKFICGGTLLSDRHVITAAHCMKRRGEQTSLKNIVVKLGVHNLNDWSDDSIVTRKLMAATIHEEFDPATLKNDILMLTMNKRVQFTAYIRPACLWADDPDLMRIVGTSGTVAGWGDQGPGGVGGQGEPHMVRIPIVSTNVCRASKPTFHKITYDSTLCAGDRKGSGPCVGDSGGGLYLLESGRWRVRGVVSVSLQAENGQNTCNLNEYVVFTDTAKYLPWIRNILSQKYFD